MERSYKVIQKEISENSPQIYFSHKEKWFSAPAIQKSVYNTLFSSEGWILIQNSAMWKKIIIERVPKGFYETNELAQIGREGQ